MVAIIHGDADAATQPLHIPPGRVSELEAFAAELLALSNERDQWQAYALALGRWMYRAGYEDGKRDQAREDNRAFAAAPPPHPLPDGPTVEELAARRADHGWMCVCRECFRGAK